MTDEPPRHDVSLKGSTYRKVKDKADELDITLVECLDRIINAALDDVESEPKPARIPSAPEPGGR